MKSKVLKTVGTLAAGLALTFAVPAAALAEGHGGNEGGGHENGASHFNGSSHYEAGHEYRDHDRDDRGRRYYSGGPSVYLGTPAYGYNNSCGYYDAYGYWHADPYCSVPY